MQAQQRCRSIRALDLDVFLFAGLGLGDADVLRVVGVMGFEDSLIVAELDEDVAGFGAFAFEAEADEGEIFGDRNVTHFAAEDFDGGEPAFVGFAESVEIGLPLVLGDFLV